MQHPCRTPPNTSLHPHQLSYDPQLHSQLYVPAAPTPLPLPLLLPLLLLLLLQVVRVEAYISLVAWVVVVGVCGRPCVHHRV